MKLKFEISYIDKDGNKVDGQIFTAENVSSYLKNLEEWGCKNILVKSLDEVKEDVEEEKDFIEIPHEEYTSSEDIIRVNDELDKKAKAGKLVGIRKEPKLLMLAEPEINGIWTIYLNDRGFIEKIVLF